MRAVPSLRAQEVLNVSLNDPIWSGSDTEAALAMLPPFTETTLTAMRKDADALRDAIDEGSLVAALETLLREDFGALFRKEQGARPAKAAVADARLDPDLGVRVFLKTGFQHPL